MTLVTAKNFYTMKVSDVLSLICDIFAHNAVPVLLCHALGIRTEQFFDWHNSCPCMKFTKRVVLRLNCIIVKKLEIVKAEVRRKFKRQTNPNHNPKPYIRDLFRVSYMRLLDVQLGLFNFRPSEWFPVKFRAREHNAIRLHGVGVGQNLNSVSIGSDLQKRHLRIFFLYTHYLRQDRICRPNNRTQTCA